jgi:hypothetical protein
MEGNAVSRLKDLAKKTPVHERGLEIRTYGLENNQLIVEGWLQDERLVPRYHLDGRLSPPDKVHRICVRLLLGGWPLAILDAEAEMPIVPHEECSTTLHTIEKIVGLSIVHGFSDEVLERLGGIQGCTHMTHLIIAIGNAVLQGFWSHKLQRPRQLDHTIDKYPEIDSVINTCQLWREDGPLVQRLRTELKNLGETPGSE